MWTGHVLDLSKLKTFEKYTNDKKTCEQQLHKHADQYKEIRATLRTTLKKSAFKEIIHLMCSGFRYPDL